MHGLFKVIFDQFGYQPDANAKELQYHLNFKSSRSDAAL